MKTVCRLCGSSALFVLLFTAQALAHCEVPCGIYGDRMRIEMMNEDLETIGKSMAMINTLQSEPTVNYNQLVRWVVTKEEHAAKLQEIVSQYFLTQRIKPGDRDYEQKLRLLHQMLLAAMHCKQSTEERHVNVLHELIHEFETIYFKDVK